jgi:hypothetical protein
MIIVFADDQTVGVFPDIISVRTECEAVDVEDGEYTAAQKVAATVWFPKYENEEIQGWDQGMKLTIYDPLPDAKLVGRLRWRLLRFDPGFQRYRKMEFCIGTKDWASS